MTPYFLPHVLSNPVSQDQGDRTLSIRISLGVPLSLRKNYPRET